MMHRYDIGRAMRAMKVLEHEQDNIQQVFEIADALPGHAALLAVWRLRRSAFGRRLLAERPSMTHILRDRARLAAMPADSLAAGYLRFMDSERLDADALVVADCAVRRATYAPSGDEDYVWEHIRDTHDLWHVVTGFHGDLIGEPALQAFMCAQLGHPGSAALALLVFAKAPPGVRPRLVEGFMMGLRARGLLGQDWESLLPLPLADVRRRLRVRPVSHYTPMYVARA
ncbi:Coq4 family protein [Nannocystis radixulma]|jgi:ubiquinone biosynthesis protein COQ4|uniref:Coq4 family protein n=1 Tax=Nannocystis radixulma TaxID=2995305 RepID=A0ABT5B5G2_9BACT|nr:Coq4 family protein [Nannocystis radixulma]MDC0668301.1 Coq4 family protein [Nannocystis radixulma]